MLIENERQHNILRGFVTLKTNSEIVYKCTDYYGPETKGAQQWDEPDIRIEWPLTGYLTLSKKDALSPMLNDFESLLIFGENS